MSFLVVLPPVLGQLWCLSWWFCLLSWDNSDRCGIFWLGWLMDVGRYEGVAPSMWAFPAWFWRMSGSCAIYVPKNDLCFAILNTMDSDPSKNEWNVKGIHFWILGKMGRSLRCEAITWQVPSWGRGLPLILGHSPYAYSYIYIYIHSIWCIECKHAKMTGKKLHAIWGT